MCARREGKKKGEPGEDYTANEKGVEVFLVVREVKCFVWSALRL